MKPESMNIEFDADARVASIIQNGVEVGTSDFGNGMQPDTRPAQEHLRGTQISASTREAVRALCDAFAMDLTDERQRVADALQKRADLAAAKAEKAQTEADEASAT